MEYTNKTMECPNCYREFSYVKGDIRFDTLDDLDNDPASMCEFVECPYCGVQIILRTF